MFTYRILAIRYLCQTVPVVPTIIIQVVGLLNYCGLEMNGYGLDVLNMTYITENFTMEELVASATANRLKIDNTPSKDQASQLCLLAYKILQPLRDAYRKPIRISSGFRCQALNKAVNGVPTSQHLKGEAADINNGIPENRKIFELAQKMIKEGKIEVGQLINEKGYQWIHISLPDKKHKNQILHL